MLPASASGCPPTPQRASGRASAKGDILQSESLMFALLDFGLSWDLLLLLSYFSLLGVHQLCLLWPLPVSFPYSGPDFNLRYSSKSYPIHALLA